MRFFGFFGRHYRLLLLTTVASLAAAGVMIRSATPLYTISSQIMVQRVGGTGATSADDRQRELRSEQNLIVSTPVLAAALTMPGVHDIASLRGHADALKLMKQQIRVDTGRGDDLLDLSCDNANPREGTCLLAAVVDSYVRFRSGLHGTPTDGSTAAVLAERQKAMMNLKQKRDALQQFGAAHGLAEGNEQVEAADEVLHELAVQLAQARVQTVSARAAFDEIQHDLLSDPRMKDRLMHYKDDDSSLAAGDEQAIAKQICTLQTQLAGYGTKFMANYEPVLLLHRKIEDLKLTRDAIVQQRWQAAVRNESELQASYDEEQAVVTQRVADQQTFEQHKTDVADAQKQLAAFDKQLKDLDAANKLITTMVTVIEPATASDAPTSPHIGWILLMATASGLVLGCGISGICELRTPTVASGNLKMLGDGLPVLARLPAVSRRQLSMNSWRDRLVDSAAEFAEACRQVQTALESIASFSGGRTVVITSTAAREGKSTLTSLLALTLAQSGKRVLLVDANLHAPQQGTIFDIEGEYGLGQLLEAEIESTFVSHVHPGIDAGMDILLAGSTEAPIAELLNSPHFTNLMAAMAAEYEYVLIDSPALSAGVEARLIASSCDATIVLAGESNLNRKVLNKTRDSLTSVGANVIGVVINRGMAAGGEQPALINVELPKPAPVRVKALRPEPAATPDPIPEAVVDVVAEPVAQPVQTVVAAQVRRAATDDADEELPLPEIARHQSLWSYAFVAMLLIGGWMAFSTIWGAPAGTDAARMAQAHGQVAARRVISSQPESVAIVMAGFGLVVVMVIAAVQARPPYQELAVVGGAGILAVCSFCAGVMNTPASAMQASMIAASAVQSILLFASLLFGCSVVRHFAAAEMVSDVEEQTFSDMSVAVFAQASAMSAMMILLSQWHSKGECLAVIAFSSCLASMLAHWLSPLRSSVCLWLSPLAVALLGYGCAALSAHGMHMGVMTALSRPLPMDYASMGPIGAVLGFWIARTAGRITWAAPSTAQ